MKIPAPPQLRRLSLVCCATASFVICAPAAAPQPGAKPSFDCAKASSAREHTVCTSPELSALDSQVGAAYTALRARLSPPASESIRNDQREWLHWLDLVCPAHGPVASGNTSLNGCLKGGYADRLKELQLSPARAGAPLIYLRTEHDYVAASRAEKAATAGISPGFGTGSFAWPQFDNPSPAQAAWNQAIYAAVFASATGADPAKGKTTLASSVDAEDTLSVTASVLTANEHVIISSIVLSTYGYGAAHPNTAATYHNWLLQPGRELKADDVFQPDSNYFTALTPTVIAKMQPAIGDGTFPKPEEIRKAVADELRNPRAWEPTRTGLTINFGQYEVGPYSSGMPSAELPWSTLKPYLAPGFDPGTFPAPPPKAR